MVSKSNNLQGKSLKNILGENVPVYQKEIDDIFANIAELSKMMSAMSTQLDEEEKIAKTVTQVKQKKDPRILRDPNVTTTDTKQIKTIKKLDSTADILSKMYAFMRVTSKQDKNNYKTQVKQKKSLKKIKDKRNKQLIKALGGGKINQTATPIKKDGSMGVSKFGMMALVGAGGLLFASDAFASIKREGISTKYIDKFEKDPFSEESVPDFKEEMDPETFYEMLKDGIEETKEFSEEGLQKQIDETFEKTKSELDDLSGGLFSQITDAYDKYIKPVVTFVEPILEKAESTITTLLSFVSPDSAKALSEKMGSIRGTGGKVPELSYASPSESGGSRGDYTPKDTSGGLKSLLYKGESKSYNQLVIPTDKSLPSTAPLTDMTIGEVLEYQRTKMSGRYPSTAVGKYQIINTTLLGAVNALGLDLNAKFDERMQDKIYSDFLVSKKRPAINNFVTGNSDNIEAAQLALAQEFASFPVPYDVMRPASAYWSERLIRKGESYYAGVSSNPVKAHISLEESRQALLVERQSRLGTVNTSTQIASSTAPVPTRSAGIDSTIDPNAYQTLISTQTITNIQSSTTALNQVMNVTPPNWQTE